MAKIMVIKEPGEDGVPFLTGILVQSLLSAGLSFQNAYATARAVRDRGERRLSVGMLTRSLEACAIDTESANRDIEDTIRDILDKINRKISERHPPDPAILV